LKINLVSTQEVIRGGCQGISADRDMARWTFEAYGYRVVISAGIDKTLAILANVRDEIGVVLTTGCFQGAGEGGRMPDDTVVLRKPCTVEQLLRITRSVLK